MADLLHSRALWLVRMWNCWTYDADSRRALLGRESAFATAACGGEGGRAGNAVGGAELLGEGGICRGLGVLFSDKKLGEGVVQVLAPKALCRLATPLLAC